jgi:hypothetical protein
LSPWTVPCSQIDYYFPVPSTIFTSSRVIPPSPFRIESVFFGTVGCASLLHTDTAKLSEAFYKSSWFNLTLNGRRIILGENSTSKLHETASVVHSIGISWNHFILTLNLYLYVKMGNILEHYASEFWNRLRLLSKIYPSAVNHDFQLQF